MSVLLEKNNDVDSIIESSRLLAKENKLNYAGSLSPIDAWHLIADKKAILIDIRSAEEIKFVGHVPNSINVPWMTGLNLVKNTRFLAELAGKVKKEDVILLLCRSGKRSKDAAEAATKAGFKNVFNISEGFEGDLNENTQRGHFNGWRFHNLPWIQD